MSEKKSQELIIKDTQSLNIHFSKSTSLKNTTLQDIDLSAFPIDWTQVEIKNTTFLGCKMNIELEIRLREKGATIFITQNHLPYKPYRKGLYTWQELMEGYSPVEDNCLDLRIYKHFSKTRFKPTVKEALYQRIHDHAIDDALRQLIPFDENGMSTRRCVGIMGGHNILRDNPFYEKTVKTAKILTENGYFIASGGGPGIMEAANLGAYFAGRSKGELREALKILKKAPSFRDHNYLETSQEVLKKFPEGQENLAIPTWFYGHEPSNLFASHIAKYFSNSIREDTLLAVSLYGIIFAPGSAGTTQEIFMDAAQNHYGTYNYYSPMVFLGKQRYEIDTMIFPLLKQLSWNKEYHKLLYLTDEPKKVLKFLKKNPPILNAGDLSET